MSPKSASSIKPGAILRVLHDGENDEQDWPIMAGEVVVFEAIIAKVGVYRTGPHKDGAERMLLCRRQPPRFASRPRVWLNFCNAKLLSRPAKP